MNDAVTPMPVSLAEPCGPSLEYDAEYAVLRSRMSPRGDAQYGQFVGVPEPPPWAEIERDCRRLLLRSRDITAMIWLCRARTRLAQAEGLAQSLDALAGALEAWPDAVHPQLVLDGVRDPAVRANALAALADPEGLLGDVRDIVVASNAARRLSVRDVERAWALPRLPDAASPESIGLQFAEMRLAGPQEAAAALGWLAQASRAVRRIVEWCATHLGIDAPLLYGLSHLLQRFEPVDVAPTRHAAPQRPNTSMGPPATSRADAVLHIRAARDWFERHEPSSPVAVLLKQAERLVGLRFSQLADAIPLDLLRRWDSAENEPS